MAAQFFTRLFGTLCPHRFSWPRSGSNGQDYQVCLICGTAFGYDWSVMRRTGPLPFPPDAANWAASRSDASMAAKARPPV
jgi:hypothetical protein